MTPPLSRFASSPPKGGTPPQDRQSRLHGGTGLWPRRLRTLCPSGGSDTPGSARVLTNAGFQYLGDAESFSVARGTTAPTWTYIRKLG